MKNFEEIKKSLDELRIDILDQINAEPNTQDLSNHFEKLKQSDPEVHKLLVLIYSEFQTTSKSNKKQVILLIDKALNIKYQTMHKMSEYHKPSWDRLILDLITWKNLKRILFTIVLLMTFLFALYEIDDKAFDAIFEQVRKILTLVIDKD